MHNRAQPRSFIAIIVSACDILHVLVKEQKKDMTPFNPKNEKILTLDKIFEQALAVVDKVDAEAFLNQYADYIKCLNPVAVDPMKIAKINLAYWAGYYDHPTRLHVENLFDCVHPVLGKATEIPPTAQECFDAGLRFAREGIDESFN